MLVASEFSIGHVGTVEALTLVLPTNQHDRPFLVVPAADGPVAVFLGGEHQFLAFDSRGNESWKGILVTSIGIEVDVASVELASFSPPGAMVRREDGLFLAARRDRGQATSLFSVVNGLVACGPTMTAAFTRWQVVLGAGTDRRILWTVDLEAKTSAAFSEDSALFPPTRRAVRPD